MSSTTTTEQCVELSQRTTPQVVPGHSSVFPNPETGERVSSLPPVDGGIGAWSFLAAAFITETIVWGVPNAFGVFLNAYLQDPRYANQKNAAKLLPLTGTFATGMMYCSGPIIYPLITRSPYLRRPLLWVGTLIGFAGLFYASFRTDVEVLLVMQGIVYGIGGALVYAPCMSFLSEWFVERRGFASGVIYAGTAVGGLFLPLALPRVIEKLGTAKALRALSVGFLLLMLPVLPFLRPRVPDSRVQGPVAASRSYRAIVLKNRPFILVNMANVLQGTAYFVPVVWLPTFASELGLTQTRSSLALSLLNGLSVISRLSFGVFSDKFNPWMIALNTALASSIITFVLWGVLSHSIGGLVAFGIMFGAFAGGWSSLFTSFVRPLAENDPQLATSLLGVLMFSRGLGNILSTLISTALIPEGVKDMSKDFHPSLGFDVGEGKYRNMIIYVGSCFAGTGAIAMLGLGIDSRLQQ